MQNHPIDKLNTISKLLNLENIALGGPIYYLICTCPMTTMENPSMGKYNQKRTCENDHIFSI